MYCGLSMDDTSSYEAIVNIIICLATTNMQNLCPIVQYFWKHHVMLRLLTKHPQLGEEEGNPLKHAHGKDF